MESKKLIAYFPLTAFWSMGVFDVINDVDDYLVVAQLKEGKKDGRYSTCKIFTSKHGRQFIRTHGMRIYLDDIIRLA